MAGTMWSTGDAPTQRLSKPRTNTSSSTLLNLASQQSQPSSPITSIEHSPSGENTTVPVTQAGDRRSRRKSRARLRDYLHHTSSDDEEGPKQRVTKRGVKERLSRSRSSHQLASSSSSLVHLSSSSSRELDSKKMKLVREEIKEKAM